MTRGKNRQLTIFLLLPLLLLSSCNSNIVFTDTHIMPDNTWKLMDISKFTVPITDTLTGHNIFFTIRSGSSYPYQNIYLFVTTISPEGKTISDTLQYNLADEHGKLKGKGLGDIRELDLPYKSNVYFPRQGNYRFNIRHGMRIEDLKGIYDFGLRIEKIRRQ